MRSLFLAEFRGGSETRTNGEPYKQHAGRNASATISTRGQVEVITQIPGKMRKRRRVGLTPKPPARRTPKALCAGFVNNAFRYYNRHLLPTQTGGGYMLNVLSADTSMYTVMRIRPASGVMPRRQAFGVRCVSAVFTPDGAGATVAVLSAYS